MTDWATKFGYFLKGTEPMTNADSDPKEVAAFIRGRIAGLREAAEIVAYYAGGDKQHSLAMQEIRSTASKLDPT